MVGGSLTRYRSVVPKVGGVLTRAAVKDPGLGVKEMMIIIGWPKRGAMDVKLQNDGLQWIN